MRSIAEETGHPRLMSALLSAEAGDKFRVLCRAAFDGVMVHDRGTIVEANEKFAEMFGCKLSEIVGRHFLDFTAPEMRATALERAAANADGAYETVALKASGERFPIELCAISVQDSTLRVVAVRDLSDRRISEELERSRLERIRILTEVAFDGICVHKDGKLGEANESFARMSGYDAAELIGIPIQRLFPNEEGLRVLEQIGKGARTYETYLLRKDGTTFPIEVCGARVPSGEHVVAVRDISSRREAEDALRISEDRFRDLVENASDVIGVHDLDGRILAANAALRKALNTASDELSNIQEHLPPGHGSSFADYLDVLRRDGTASGTMGVMTSDGGRRLWEYRSSLRTEGVKMPVARVLARDVTERDESLAAARVSAEHFRSIIENSSDLIAIIETDGKVRYQSPSIERVLAITADSFVGRNFVDLVHPDSRQMATDFLVRQIAQPSAEGMVALRFQHRNGSWRSFEVAGRNVTSDGIVTAIVTNARDVTDRKMLEGQLAQANRLSSLGRLAATVAHEFNNVLMGMQPFTELMQRPDAAPSMITKGAWHISNSIQRGKRIVLDILRFTQPAQPLTARVDVGEWWEKFAPEAEIVVGNQIRIVSTIPERGMCVVADKQQLSQVMANLVTNARDAMPAGGTLTVGASQPAVDTVFEFGVVPHPDEFVQLSVTDTGHGMLPEVLEHIFEPLFTTKQSGGTGLGLAVAHQVLTQHGGYIFAQSNVDGGTAFHLFFPKGEAPCDEACDAPTQTDKTSGLTMLMIEDEELIVEGITALLQAEGLNVFAVRTGGEACAAVTKFQPDVVFLDFGLPDMDGSEVHAMLRKNNPLLPVIFASGHADPRFIHGGTADQNTRFLQKPFDGAALLEVIADLRPGVANR